MSPSSIEHGSIPSEKMKTELKIVRWDSFAKDLKKLKKKFSTLEDDLKVLIRSLIEVYHLHGIDSGGIFAITGLGIEGKSFYKVKKFACKSLKGKGSRTGLRLIYRYDHLERKVELIEIYYKQEKANEDRERIKRFYKK